MDYKSKEDAIIFPYIKSLYTSGKIIDIGCKSGKWALYLKDTIPEENWIMFDAISKFIKDLSRFYKKSELHSLALSDVNEDKRKFVIDKKIPSSFSVRLGCCLRLFRNGRLYADY